MLGLRHAVPLLCLRYIVIMVGDIELVAFYDRKIPVTVSQSGNILTCVIGLSGLVGGLEMDPVFVSKAVICHHLKKMDQRKEAIT